MRALAIVAAALAAAGCVRRDGYVCTTDEDCTVGGVAGFCEADLFCSVADATCPSGHRYIDDAGELSGTCTAGGGDPTALCLVGPAIAEPDACAAAICADEPWCCDVSWDKQCALAAEARCDLACDELVAGTGLMVTSVFELETPDPPLWSTSRPGFAQAVAWGDANNDGRADLAIARDAGDGADGVEIHLNEGITDDTLVMAQVDITGADLPTCDRVEWRDYNADGRLDLLTSGPNGTFVIANTPTGFDAALIAPEPTVATWVDTDGIAPYAIAIGYAVEGDERVVLHQMDAAFGLDPITGDNVIGDFGTNDLVWCSLVGNANRDLVGSGSVWTGTTDGFTPPNVLGATGLGVVCADLDDDGDNDLAMGDYDAPTRVLRNQGGVSGAPAFTSATSVHFAGIAVADLDDNGRLDLVVVDGRNDGGNDVPNYVLDNVGTPGEADWFDERMVPDFNPGDRDAKGIAFGPRPR